MAEIRVLDFFKCMNKRCQVNHWPAYIGEQCPVCGLSGWYAGPGMNQADLQRATDEEDE